MKISKCLALGLLAFSLTQVWGQNTLTLTGIPRIPTGNSQPAPDAKNLTTFNLDFTGGPPSELINQIQKATGKPLNVIIPNEYAQEDLPPLKMSKVNVVQLFQALEAASVKVEPYVTSRFPGGGGVSSYSQLSTSYGFKTDASPVTDDSIWYFYGRDKVGKTPQEPPPAKAVHFYQLAPYLDRGFTVDDITTAIQTGWKMEGTETPPEISYHKETKMLIAYGEPEKLNTINEVLQTLPSVNSFFFAPQMNQMNNNILQLQQQVKELQNKVSASSAQPPLSPEAQIIQMEANRAKWLESGQAPPPILPPPPIQTQASPEKSKAGQ